MKKFPLIIVLALVGMSSCKKEIKTLPDITQSGAGTFGAKINGENWGPLKAGILPTAPLLEASFSADSSIIINARNFSRTPIETEMEIYLKNVSSPGIIELNKNTEVAPGQAASYAYYVKRNVNVTDEWITSSNATGQVIITKVDRAARFISGTFKFMANSRYGSAPINVTDGRFDVKIQ